MMKFHSKIITFLLIFLSSCSQFNYKDRADNFAEENYFEKKMIWGKYFLFTTYERITSLDDDIIFYIEGDGLAFRAGMPSYDPTPNDLLVLKLAASDTRNNIIYLARPCQFTDMELNPNCHNQYWTSHRFAEEVISDMNLIISKMAGQKNIHLIGFSGGGGVAVLVAARNKNVSSIMTIAGNLDHVEFNNHHNVKPMHGSLNPIDYVKYTRHIPQVHFAGAKDTVVPLKITEKFVNRANSPKVSLKVIKDADHNKGWQRIWPSLLSTQKKDF